MSFNEPKFSTAGGTSDARFFARHGVQVLELGPINKSIHKIDEHVAIDDLKKLKVLYEKVLLKLKNHLEIEFSLQLNYPIQEFSAQKFAQKINIPGLIVHDCHDTVVRFSEGLKTAKLWKNGNFHATQNLGHSLHSPDLYQQILQYITS